MAVFLDTTATRWGWPEDEWNFFENGSRETEDRDGPQPFKWPEVDQSRSAGIGSRGELPAVVDGPEDARQLASWG
jgi:hypothetical protein